MTLPGHWSFSLHFNKFSRHTGAHFRAHQPTITGLRDLDWRPKAARSKSSLQCKRESRQCFSHCTLLVLLVLRLWIGPRLTELSFYIAPISLELFGGICCHQRYKGFCCCVKSLNLFFRVFYLQMAKVQHLFCGYNQERQAEFTVSEQFEVWELKTLAVVFVVTSKAVHWTISHKHKLYVYWNDHTKYYICKW